MWNDNASNIDILFYEPYSNVVFNIINNVNNTPITIGLFGSWGAGKSSVLNFIEDKITDNHGNYKICCIKINAWLLEGYEDAKLSIVEMVLEAIKNNETAFQSIKEGISKLIKKVNWLKVAKVIGKTGISIGLSALSGNPLPAISSVASTIATSLAKEADENGEEFINDDDQSVEKNIREIRDEFESLLSKSPIDNLVVMIDDLDRCSPERIMDVLEAVKLFLSVKKTTFVFAVDETIVRYSINRKYNGDVNYPYDSIAKDYIEKIIQIPIILPSLSSKDIENYLLLLYYQSQFGEEEFSSILKKVKEKKLLINERSIEPEDIDSIAIDYGFTPQSNKHLFEKTRKTICNVRRIVSNSLKGNPRQAKRFLNAFFVKKELASFYFDEIDENILAKLMALYLIDGSAFKELNEWNKNYDGSIRQLESLEKGQGFSEYKSWDKENVRKWLDSEPRELYKQNLNKYFYLTKEYLTNQTFGDFSNEDREMLGVIVNGEPIAVGQYLKQLREEGKTLDGIIEIVLTHFKNKKININVIASIFEFFEQYRKQIIDVFRTLPKEHLSIGAIPAIKKMISLDENVKVAILGNDKIDEKIKDKIKG